MYKYFKTSKSALNKNVDKLRHFLALRLTV